MKLSEQCMYKVGTVYLLYCTQTCKSTLIYQHHCSFLPLSCLHKMNRQTSIVQMSATAYYALRYLSLKYVHIFEML